MPLDNRMSLMYFYHRAQWTLEFVWRPRRCQISRRWLWLELAYRGTVMWTGPGEPHYEYIWHDRNEHLIWTLKNA